MHSVHYFFSTEAPFDIIVRVMHLRHIALFFFISAFAWSAYSFVAHADIVTLFTQSDDSGDMTSSQETFQNTWITSESLGNLVLDKNSLSLTFTIKDPNASTVHDQPGGVALATCATCNDLQTYTFTDADRTLLADGAFHTFTVQTATTTRDDADGTVPIYIEFFNLSQYKNSTHLKSNAAGTIPTLVIKTTSSTPTASPVPSDFVTAYEQNDRTGRMDNPQTTFQNSYIDSASLGNVHLGQGELYLTFMMKDPNASTVNDSPAGVCIQQEGSTDCTSRLQTYLFTDAERTLLADGGFHIFTVKTGTTTSTYADGTRAVSVGFFGLSQYQHQTKIKSNAANTIPYLTIQMAPLPDPCIAAGNCVSSVLFLPGIKGSRLYEGIGCGQSVEKKLWEPSVISSIFRVLVGIGDPNVERLFLDVLGNSVCSDIYTKADDIIDSAGGSDIYKTFIDEMNGLETGGTINDWKPVAYDWRLSLTDLLNNGAERDGKIYYTEATSTPYIEQTLRALAIDSKTKKVTIVAHSNGGLVAKALLAKLGNTETLALVDKIILVGAPQSGAPVALGAILFGQDQGINLFGIQILRTKVARQLSINSPMAYHLLPSQNYFESIASDIEHPVARFAGDAYAKEISAYGSTIGNVTNLYKFLRADEGGRVKPSASNVHSAEVGNATLIDYANTQHTTLDAWTPPSGIEVSQVAGWGVDTVAGIDFIKVSAISALTSVSTVRDYRPIFVEDGDGTVPIPSALMLASSTNVKRYWVDLFHYNNDFNKSRKHRDLFEIPSLQDFIKNIIKNSTSTLPTYISTSQPASITNKKLSFFLHSPLNMQVTDSLGNVTGLSSDGYINQGIPGSTYGELGDVAYIIVPEGGTYQLSLVGLMSGTFTLDMQESSGNIITASSTIANVPTTSSTLASLTVTGALSTVSALTVDTNGDGKNIITIIPVLGDTVVYEAPAPTPAPQTSSSGGGGGGGRGVSDATSFTLVATTTTAITTPSVATSTPIAIVEQKTFNASLTLSSPVVTSVPTVTRITYEVAEKQEDSSIPQTASAYDASQQVGLRDIGALFYTVLIGLFIISLLALAVYKDHTAK